MALTDGQLGRLTEDGYLHVPGVVPDPVLLAVEWEYDKILSDLIDRLVTSERPAISAVQVRSGNASLPWPVGQMFH